MPSQTRCPMCLRGLAASHPVYGLIPCKSCLKGFKGVEVNRTHEFTSSSIKGERKEFAASMLQPFYRGQLSREYIEKWGTSKLKGITKKDIKNAKYVYKNLSRHHKIQDSKI